MFTIPGPLSRCRRSLDPDIGSGGRVGVGWGLVQVGVGQQCLAATFTTSKRLRGWGLHNADTARINSKGLGARGARARRTLKSAARALMTSAVTFDLL